MLRGIVGQKEILKERLEAKKGANSGTGFKTLY